MGKLELLRDYNATAHLYDKRYRDEQIPKINFLLDKLRPKEGDILLDVGCGTGLLFERVSCRLILGVDISINMLREAKKRAREGAGSKQNPFGKIKDVELILADAEFLPIRSGSMDIVVSITALQLAGDQDRAIYEMLRVLKDQGSFGISIIKKASIPKGLPNGTEVYDMEEIKDVFCVGRKER